MRIHWKKTKALLWQAGTQEELKDFYSQLSKTKSDSTPQKKQAATASPQPEPEPGPTASVARQLRAAEARCAELERKPNDRC